jgi:type II secretory pathway pseudopilin PulG
MRIIASLKYQIQLQTFLAFDVTATFSSAVILSLATFISARPFDLVGHIQEALEVLQELASRGNVQAQKRKHELDSLGSALRAALDHYSDSNEPPEAAVAGNMGAITIPDSAGNPDIRENLTPPGRTLSTAVMTPGEMFDLHWDNLSTSTFLDAENSTEDFDSFFAQIGDYSEFVPLGLSDEAYALGI